MWVAESPEVVPEKHLLKATMALSLYMKRNCPDLTTHIHDAVFNIVNNRLGTWIREQGGWVSSEHPDWLTNLLSPKVQRSSNTQEEFHTNCQDET